MAFFVVTYDLKEGQNYEPIIGRLEALGGIKPQESIWLLDLTDSVADILQDLKAYLPTPASDKLMVVEFSKRPKYTKAFVGTNDWINARFP